MAHCNPGCDYDETWFADIHIDLAALNRRAATLKTKRCVKKAYQAAWLLRACTCIDLTTLAGDDTDANVQRLCFKVHCHQAKLASLMAFLLGGKTHPTRSDQAAGDAGLQHHNWRRLRLPKPGQECRQVAQGSRCRFARGECRHRFSRRSNPVAAAT